MTGQEEMLWQRIQHFQLDEPGTAFKFSDRLARENGWSLVYAKRVIEEYKRFIFLCCVSDRGVTPSDPVDQAWHLHLTFTRSYWIDLCKNTLQKDIHHNPTKGGETEAKKFDGYYTFSHQFYTEKFGNNPPSDIWQDNHTRFSDINFKRVNLSRYWLLPKPKFSLKIAVLALVVFSSALFIQASSTDYIIYIITGIAAFFIFSQLKDNNGNSGCGTGSGCSNNYNDSSHHSDGHHGDGDSSGCNSGCSGCSGSGCSGCGGGGD
ncbi:hypothetical protein ACFQZS_09605 [Mucilaginibacter calamicampi]|uniref:TIGR04222 domain-containing protein n=1 Tax=Mucilaginibacter calamicampi TaxID=1302352 RepID=A0ABW2YWB9_9SPHI